MSPGVDLSTRLTSLMEPQILHACSRGMVLPASEVSWCSQAAAIGVTPGISLESGSGIWHSYRALDASMKHAITYPVVKAIDIYMKQLCFLESVQ